MLIGKRTLNEPKRNITKGAVINRKESEDWSMTAGKRWNEYEGNDQTDDKITNQKIRGSKPREAPSAC